MRELLFTRINGQKIAYFDYGQSDDVIFWHHGMSTAGPIPPLLKRHADSSNFRIVEVIRSGYGNSSSLPNRTVSDMANINLEIANALGIERFAIIGISGGGPPALALAHISGERCIGVVIVAGIAPFVESNFDFYEGMDELNRQEWMDAQEDMKRFEENISQHASQWSGYDFEQIKSIINSNTNNVVSDERISAFHINTRYSFMQGPNGLREDFLAFLQPWGFSFSELSSPVCIWSGNKDVNVPVGHAKWLHQSLSGSELIILEGEDHRSVVEPAYVSGFAWLRDVFSAS